MHPVLESASTVLVVDLEATTSDDGSLARWEMETIEIGAVLVDAASVAVIAEYQTFVRPMRRPRLLPFCTKLTGITQAMVDGAPTFALALDRLDASLIRPYRPGVVFASWGDFDEELLAQDCTFHRLRSPMPRHVNLKLAFRDALGMTKKLGMAEALSHVGVPLVGTHHRGIDDARNIVRLLPWILGRRDAVEISRPA